MTTHFTHRKDLELAINFVTLTIDWIEDLAFQFEETMPYHRNILTFVYRAPRGSGNYYEDVARNRKHFMKPGSIHLLPVGRVIRFHRTEEVEAICLHFSLEYFGNFDVFAHADRFHTFNDPGLVRKMRRLFASVDAIRTMLEIRAEVMKICARYCPRHIQWPDEAAREFGGILAVMADRCDATTSVNDLAQLMNCRRETLSRNFKRALGLSPTEWLHRTLMNRIARMLNDPTLSIKEIAGILNFSSQFYLSRFFKKRVGVSPSEYRRITNQGKR